MKSVEDWIDELIIKELNNVCFGCLDVTEHTFLWNEARRNCIKAIPVFNAMPEDRNFTEFFKQIACFSFVASRLRLIDWYKKLPQGASNSIHIHY